MGKKKRTIRTRLTLLSIIPVLAAGFLLVIIYILISYNKDLGMYKDEGTAVANAYASSVENTVKSLSQQFDVVTKNTAIVDENLSIDDRKTLLSDAAYTSTFKDFSISYSCEVLFLSL